MGKDFIRHETNGIVCYSFAALDELGFFSHWVTTRIGGVSNGGYESLNLGDHVGDSLEAVIENRLRVSKEFCGGKAVALPIQVHGTKVIELRNETGVGCEADGVIVVKPAIPAGVLTADCLPIIIADPQNKSVAVIHAGRQGLFKGIIANAITELSAAYGGKPDSMRAAIAPGIRECCYEISEDIFNGGGFDSFRRYASGGKLDMISAAKDQLAASGIEEGKIYDSGICTSCSNEEFFSHRKQSGKAGRFMTGVMLRDT